MTQPLIVMVFVVSTLVGSSYGQEENHQNSRVEEGQFNDRGRMKRFSQRGQDRRGHGSQRGPGSKGTPGPMGWGNRKPEQSEFQSETGFLFVNGKVLSPPYRVAWEDEQIALNDELVDANPRDWRLRPGTIAASLQMDAIVVVDGGWVETYLAPTEQGEWLLKSFAGTPEEQLQAKAELKSLLPEKAYENLQFNAPDSDLVSHAQEVLVQLDEVENTNNGQVAAVRRMERVSYPLTMFGMILTVVAFGHLLSTRPEAVSAGINATPQAMQMVVRSIAFVVLLSALDLIWTILAWQAGQMKELNPIASQFIDNPIQLVCFKAIATFAGAALLVGLRQYRQAQLASWWMCLVCTVLTFRWLTFHSMMMG
ncbi:DUF5658 family protein [Thalassoglobus neptunius]|uniref:DUF5658 family protein n=1 Tax=Thalassoglobus neptunius TaxID=1938619 RepID=UPI0011B6F12D|nr:DUF5658 family protein [Thalassoglobus neptunius]